VLLPVAVWLMVSALGALQVLAPCVHAAPDATLHWLLHTGLVTFHVPLLQVAVAVPDPLGAKAAVLSVSALTTPCAPAVGVAEQFRPLAVHGTDTAGQLAAATHVPPLCARLPLVQVMVTLPVVGAVASATLTDPPWLMMGVAPLQVLAPCVCALRSMATS